MKEITQDIFIEFIEKHHPEKLRYHPKIIEISGNIVVFKMKEHKGHFAVNIMSNP